MKPARDYKNLSWKEVQDRPALTYAEEGGDLIIRYFRVNINTTWRQIENIIDIKNWYSENKRKSNPAAIKRALKSAVDVPCTSQKLNGVRLFSRLVMEGVIQRSDRFECFWKAEDVMI